MDRDTLKHELLKLKEDWVEYKRTANKLKKQEKQINWMNQKYEDYLESAEHAMLKTEDCDMHCAHQCIKEREDVSFIVDCMHNDCKCDFYFDVSEIIEEEEECEEDCDSSEKSSEEESENACSDSCTSLCVDPKTDEASYKECMKDTCDCSDSQIPSLASMLQSTDFHYTLGKANFLSLNQVQQGQSQES